MRNIILIIVLLTLFIPVNFTMASETLYPSGYNLASQYGLSSSNITTADTLLITRTVQNNESFAVSGLYFSENLPPEFSLIGYSIRLNGNNIANQFTANITPLIVNGYTTYEWVVDDPDGNPQNVINPGQTLVFELRLVCASIGEYQLPFHTAAFSGGNSGFYSTDQAIALTVSGTDDNIPPAAIGDLHASD
jgi:hypothetical protein